MNKVTKTVRIVKTRTVKTYKQGKGRRRPNGLILYRGPSLLDGTPIVVVAIFKSRNEKTGPMVQTYILADDGQDPLEAVKTGGAAAVCGNCPHMGRSCYVNVSQAPLSIWRAVQRGIYPIFHAPKHLHWFERRFVRLGSYGDPAAVPYSVWALITSVADGWTGYTHQWKTCDPQLSRLCMASCDTPRQREDAVARGWRTFRIRLAAGDPLREGEFVCPASKEAGKRLTCEECRACSGTKAGGKNVSPAIVWHGPDNGAGDWKYIGFVRTVTALKAEENRRVPLAVLN